MCIKKSACYKADFNLLKIPLNPRPITWKKLRDLTNLSDGIYWLMALKVFLLSRVEKVKLPFFLVTIAKRGSHFPLNITDAIT